MNIHKNIFFTLALLSMALLSACTSKQEPLKVPQPKQEEPQVKNTYFSFEVNTPISADPVTYVAANDNEKRLTQLYVFFLLKKTSDTNYKLVYKQDVTDQVNTGIQATYKVSVDTKNVVGNGSLRVLFVANESIEWFNQFAVGTATYENFITAKSKVSWQNTKPTATQGTPMAAFGLLEGRHDIAYNNEGFQGTASLERMFCRIDIKNTYKFDGDANEKLTIKKLHLNNLAREGYPVPKLSSSDTRPVPSWSMETATPASVFMGGLNLQQNQDLMPAFYFFEMVDGDLTSVDKQPFLDMWGEVVVSRPELGAGRTDIVPIYHRIKLLKGASQVANFTRNHRYLVNIGTGPRPTRDADAYTDVLNYDISAFMKVNNNNKQLNISYDAATRTYTLLVSPAQTHITLPIDVYIAPESHTTLNASVQQNEAWITAQAGVNTIDLQFNAAAKDKHATVTFWSHNFDPERYPYAAYKIVVKEK